MSLRVEKTEYVASDSTSTNQTCTIAQEQTFNYQPTEDDKNAGLQVEHKKKTQAQKPQNQEQSKTAQQNTGKLLLSRGAAIIMTPIAASAGVLTLVAGAVNGIVNPNTTFDKSMTESIQAAGQGADMIEKMWQGRYF